MKRDGIQSLDESTIKQRTEQIWKEVLNVGPGNERSTFFELNGQSITAVQIVTRIEEELGVWVDVGDLFEDPDLETFVKGVVARRADAGQAER
jgi:acyl carrier protein